MKSLIHYAFSTLTMCMLACGHASSRQGSVETGSSHDGKTRFRIETVVSGVEVPWSIVFTPDGRMLFTERPGRIRVVENGTLKAEPLLTIPDVEPSGESGAMGLCLHPDFASNHLLYIAYSYRSDGKRDRVVRYRETGTSLTDHTLIIED